MAIRIPILTSFDPKGLRQANAQFAKLQGSIGSLGRNFAVAGAAIAGATAIIAKNAQSLARIERINAQTAQTIQSMGNASNISAKEVETLAGSLEALTATEAETIQEGANLLLTFKNISNQAGEGNDIFNQTTAAMVDLARAMGTSASGEAIRLGKALNDPIRGVASLTRVGVSFTEEQRNQIKALQQSGDLMGAQKIILAELQQQFGGSGAAFAQTFTGQLELMGHELGTIGEEATMSVMPALQGMLTELRELIPIIGPQLKAAIESVDFVALGKSIVGFTTFLVENATTIANVIIGIFALNTAYKLMQVAIGISNVAIALKTWYMAKLTTGMTLATIATGAFSTALRLIPFVAIATGIGLVIAGIMETDSSYRTATPVVTSFGQEIVKTGHDAEWAAGKYGIATNAVKDYNAEIGKVRAPQLNPRQADAAAGIFDTGPAAPAPISFLPPASTGAGSTKTSSPLEQLYQQANKTAAVIKKEGALERAGLTKEVAQWVTSSNKPIIAAREAQARIAKNGAKAVANLTKQYTKSAAGQQAAASAAAEASAQAQAAHNAMVAAQAAAAAAEAAALAERERVYNSFLDSVKSTFAGIKNAILGAFDLTELGGSTNAITRNMDKMLVKLRSFATNVSKLSGMGLNSALLQQVISAGPLAGARLAESLVMGGASALGAINAGYAEFGALSSQIAQTGTESLFNRDAQQNVYNINVDGGVGSGATIGKAIVDAIKSYERTSGAVWQGA
jgi:uncharacterized protein YdbL (DUF1318 family)